MVKTLTVKPLPLLLLLLLLQ